MTADAQVPVLLVKEAGTPYRSVELLQRRMQRALDGHCDLRTVARGEDHDWVALLGWAAVVIGVDNDMLRCRRDQGIGTPLLFPSYGLGTRGFLPFAYYGDLLNAGDGVLYPSSADLSAAHRHLRPECGLDSYLLPYGVAAPVEDMGADRLPEGWPGTGRPVLLYVGRVNLQKNVHLLVEMLAHLRRCRTDADLVIVGTPDAAGFPELGWSNEGYADYLHALIKRRDLGDRVHFLGAVPAEAMGACYRAAAVHVTLSTFRTEDFGFASVEAAYCGTPTVATAWGGFQDTVWEDHTGQRVPVRRTDHGWRVDWRAAADRVAVLLDDDDSRRRLGATAAVIARGVYHPDDFAVRLRRIVSDAARAQRSVSPLTVTDMLDDATTAFVREVQRGGNDARQGAFFADVRIARYFGAYMGGTTRRFGPDVVAYVPVDGELRDEGFVVRDPCWPATIELSPSERVLLGEVDGVRGVQEIADRLGLDADVVVQCCDELAGKGVLLAGR